MELPAVKNIQMKAVITSERANVLALLSDKEDNNPEDETMLQSNAEIYDRFGDLCLS